MRGHSRSNVTLAAADGTPLVLDLSVPEESDARIPTVVTRTPYGRSAHRDEGLGWARRGYAYVIADVRGRYDSGGDWDPYRNERADGAALVDWIVAQPWSDGRVIAYGGSYAGYTAWAMAAERPARVAAVVSLGPPMSLARTKFSSAGVLRLSEHAAWWSERADARTSRDGYAASFFAAHPRALEQLPVVEIDLGADLPGWTKVIENGPSHSDEQAITDRDLARVDVPTLHVGGWHDLLVTETLHQWRARAEAAPETPAHLMIGPWPHDLAFTTDQVLGDIDYGETSTRPWGRELVEWIDAALDGHLDARRTTVFVRGANRWETAATWPPATVSVEYWASDDGLLTAPTAGIERSLVHDPDLPFPSLPEGRDRSVLNSREDAIRFDTAPLAAPLRISGAACVEFDAESTPSGADWIVRLLEVRPNGQVIDTALGESWTDAPSASEGDAPAPRRLRIELSEGDIEFGAGSLIRVEITGADFPRIARNLGTRESRYHSADVQRVTQRLLSSDRPILTLPVVPEVRR